MLTSKDGNTGAEAVVRELIEKKVILKINMKFKTV